MRHLQFLVGGGFFGGWPLFVVVVGLQGRFFKPQVLVEILAKTVVYIIYILLFGLVLVVELQRRFFKPQVLVEIPARTATYFI